MVRKRTGASAFPGSWRNSASTRPHASDSTPEMIDNLSVSQNPSMTRLNSSPMTSKSK